jgi:hypothetical protein
MGHSRKANFKVCANCGAYAPRRKTLCCNPNGCGPSTRADRRAGRKSLWREPTTDEVAAEQNRIQRRENLIQSLIADAECFA